jgi:VCBS repeat-containing protein
MASISGVVWNDINKNAVRDANEPPVAGVAVYIDANDNKTQEVGEPTTTTASDGSYTFTGLGAGSYVVRAAIGQPFQQTFPALSQLAPDRLFVEDVFQNKISELDPVSGATIRSFTPPYRSGLFMGLAYDGKVLYFASNDNDILFKLNPDTGAVISQSLLPATSIFGMASLNGLLYVDQGVNSPILVFDPVSQTIVKQLNITGVGCCIVHGIGAVKGPDAILQVTLQDKVVEIDPGSGIGHLTIGEQVLFPNAQTSVGQNIFVGDSNGRIDIYSRTTGQFVRGFVNEPAVFGLAGLAGPIDNAQRLVLSGTQSRLAVDFGTTQPGDFPPAAGADTFGTPLSTSLHIAAPGVLKNDTDADNPTLTAVKDASPQFGTLTLNSDGSFTYVPTTGFRGNDTFTYHVNDGKVSSPPVTVTIEVGAGVTLTESGGSTKVSEDGTTDDYTVALYTTPTGPVQIAVTAGAGALVSSDGASFFNTVMLTFNDRTPQTVTVKGVDDAIIQGKHTATIKETVTGKVVDPNYPLPLPIPSVSVSIADNDAPFQNQDIPFDVNNNGIVSPADALILINYLNAFAGFALAKGQGQIPDPIGGGQGKALYVDVFPDNNLAPSDVLAVIDYLDSHPSSGGEGEGSDMAALGASSTDDGATTGLADDAAANMLALLAADTAVQPKRRK